MTQNEKSTVIKWADNVIDSHLSTGESTTSLIIKKANEEGLNKNMINRLIAKTNTRYIVKTGSRDVPIADPGEVFAGLAMYNKPMGKAASYSYPEYSGNNSMAKSASMNSRRDTGERNVVGIMRKKAHDDMVELKQQKGTLEIKSDKLFKIANDNIDTMKRSGFNLYAIKERVKVANEDLLDYVFNNNATKTNTRVNKNIYDIEDNLVKIASSLDTINDLMTDLESTETELTEINEIYNKLKNTGEVFINV
jgi:hypothetical protein